MHRSASDWENGLERDPEGSIKSIVLKIITFVVCVVVVLGVLGYGLGWFTEAGQVAKREFGPDAALKKYEWFKEQSQAIKKMDQDISLFRSRQKALQEQYVGYGEDKTKWSLDIRTQYNHDTGQMRDDLIAVISQRNNLVRDYNAASSKFNWVPFQREADRPDQSFQEYKE